MTLKEFKETINSIPEEFDTFDVAYSEIEDDYEDERSVIRTDDEINGIVIDEISKLVSIMGISYDNVLTLTGRETDGDDYDVVIVLKLEDVDEEDITEDNNN